MSKYWRWCVRSGGRCFNPDYADAFSTIGAMRATPKATWKVRCRITMKPSGMDTDQTSERSNSKLVLKFSPQKMSAS